MNNTLKHLIFAAEILVIGFCAGVVVERRRIADQLEKDEVFDQFCEILIDRGDGEVYYD